MANRYSLEAAFNLIDNVTKPLEKITGSTNAVGNAIKKNYSEAQKRVDDFGKTVEKATGYLKKAVLAVQGMAVAAAGAFVVQGVKGAIEFQTSMEKVGAQADLSKEQIKAFSNDLINLSNATGSAVSDLAEAQLEAISKGVKVADSVQFLEVAVKAANGGFTNTSTVISSLTSVLKSYGLEAGSAAKISDQMMAAAKAGGVSFADFSTKLEHVIPVAAKFGVTSEELFASIATLTSKGNTVADAAKKIKKDLEGGGKAGLFKTTQGERFNEMLKRITGSAGATEDAFNRVDSTITEQWDQTINKVKNTGLKLGTALLPVIQKIIDKVSLFVDKFSEMDFGPFIAQIEATIDRIFASIDFDQLVSGMENFFTILSKGFNLASSFVETFLKFKDVIAVIGIGGFAVKRVFDGIAIAGKIAPIIGDLKTAGSLVAGLSKGSYAAQTAFDFVSDRVKNMTKVMQGAQKVGSAIFDIGKMVAGKVAALAMAAAQGIATAATTAWGAATTALNALFVASPIGWIVLAIGALIAIIILCVKNWDKITAALAKAWEWIKNVASMIWDNLCKGFEALTGFVKQNSEKVLAFIAIFTGPFGFIISIIKELKDNWSAIVEAFKTDGIIAGFKKLGGVILSAVLAPIQGLLEMLANIPGVGKLLGPALEKVKNFREELTGLEAETTVVQNVVPAQVQNITAPAVTQTATSAAGAVSSIPSYGVNNQNNRTITAAATPATRPITTAEQYRYSETTNRDQVDIAVRADQGSSARVTRQPRSPNVRVAASGGNR